MAANHRRESAACDTWLVPVRHFRGLKLPYLGRLPMCLEPHRQPKHVR